MNNEDEAEILDRVSILNKKSSFEEVYKFALEKYNGSHDKAMRFVRGWESVGGKK